MISIYITFRHIFTRVGASYRKEHERVTMSITIFWRTAYFVWNLLFIVKLALRISRLKTREVWIVIVNQMIQKRWEPRVAFQQYQQGRKTSIPGRWADTSSGDNARHGRRRKLGIIILHIKFIINNVQHTFQWLSVSRGSRSSNNRSLVATICVRHCIFSSTNVWNKPY